MVMLQRPWFPAHDDVPGPKELPLIGSVRAFRKDELAFMTRVARTHGDVVRFRIVLPVYLLSHPSHIQHVLQERHTNYQKDPVYLRLKQALGNGLLTSNGDFWLRQRRLVQPAFHKQRLAAYATTMVDSTREMLDCWEAQHGGGRPFDAAPDLLAVTLQIVGRVLFSIDLLGAAREMAQAVTTVLATMENRLSLRSNFPSLPTAENRRFNRARALLDTTIFEQIRTRRKSGKDEGDLLSMLLAMRDGDTGEGMSDQQLRDELLTLFIAGHETTARALSWSLLLLLSNPDALARLVAELASTLGDSVPTVETLPRLVYTRQVIEESMRLFPPAWLFTRTPIADDEIGNHRIPKGSIIAICPFSLHRDPRFWPNPERFEPERFSAQAVAERPRFAYVPFAAGPRQCIGAAFAMMELQVILAMVVQRFQLRLASTAPPVPVPMVTLRPREGVSVTIARRS